MKVNLRLLFLFASAFFLIFMIYAVINNKASNKSKQKIKDLSYSEFITAIEQGSIKEVSINGSEISGLINISEEKTVKFKTRGPDKSDPYLPLLKEKGVKVVFAQSPFFCGALGLWLPFIIIIIFYFLFFRRMGAGGGANHSAFSFARSRAKLFLEQSTGVTFKDVAGVKEVKEELQEVIEFLKAPDRFTRLGGKMPKGVLLFGAPGTGKTLLARAVAGEAGVPFLSISGSGFVELFVGVGAARVRDLFSQAKQHAPCIIFIDEIDAVGGQRNVGFGGGREEHEQTLTQLLNEMDGFEPNLGVIVLAATNRPDKLDQALLRPGRFDRRIMIPLPDMEGRIAILKVHTRNKPLAPDVKLEEIAQMMVGTSGADLASLANESALLAARRKKTKIEMIDFQDARDKVLMGVERKTVISLKEREILAFHEAGHALVAKKLPGSEPVEKISIVPRGFALGVTMQRPTEDRHIYTKKEILTKIAIILGGRVAEEIIFDDVSTGAADDLNKATELAERMICEWAMADELSLGVYIDRRQVFLGQDKRERPYSEKTAEKIDNEKHKILNETYKITKDILEKNKEQLKKIAALLLRKETITHEEFESCL